jgi:Fe(3+) dicitrate transport protein
MKKYIFLTLTFFVASLLHAQLAGKITGQVIDKGTKEPLSFVAIMYADGKGVMSDMDGKFEINQLNAGTYTLTFRLVGYKTITTEVKLENSTSSKHIEVLMEMPPMDIGPPVITVYADYPGAGRMPAVSGTTIAAGKKTDVINPGNTNANLAVNNTRQLFASVPGLTIWENDGNGTGTSIGARGLSPNRSWEFNNRQNGYDMSSDAFGYPEAYYVPPAEALRGIEIMRGAASLQFGPQMGGMINYLLEEGHPNKQLTGRLSLTGGSFGMANAFGSLGGTTKEVTYYGFYNARRADGWRENSSYFTNTGYVSANWKVNEKLKVGFEFTGMNYLLRQPGGLTDSLFEVDARASYRERNWFGIRWNMPAITADYEFVNKAKLSAKVFGLFGERNSVGYTGAVNTADPGTQRTVDRDYYTNFGTEVRYLLPFDLLDEKSHLAAGVRYYRGNTQRKQGKGSAGDDADFTFANPAALARDLNLNAENAAVFAEVLLQVTDRLKVVPGARFEYIVTSAEGTPALQKESRTNTVPLFGAGAEYDLPKEMKLYANWSQSFRPATFNDVWTNQPNVRIDENLGAVRGHSMDLGIRRQKTHAVVNFDVNAFLLLIDGRIGDVAMTDDSGNPYLFRTNTGNSRNAGAEWYVDFHPLKYKSRYHRTGDISLFVSGSYIDAVYTAGANQGKRVEYAPEWNVRTGLNYRHKWLAATLSWNYMDEVYTDAKNSAVNAAATVGPLAAYQLWDFGCTVILPKNFTVKAAVNNIADVRYATRRAGGYPGPGIIPGEGRSFALGLTMKF